MHSHWWRSVKLSYGWNKKRLLPRIVIVNIDSDNFSRVFTLGRHKVKIRLQLVTMGAWRAMSVVAVVLRWRGVGMARKGVGTPLRGRAVYRVAGPLQRPGVCVVSTFTTLTLVLVVVSVITMAAVITMWGFSRLTGVWCVLGWHWFGGQGHGGSRWTIGVGNRTRLLFFRFKCFKSVVGICSWVVFPSRIVN